MPNLFGKYPASASIKGYIEAMKHYYAPQSLDLAKTMLWHIQRTLRKLGAPTNPKLIREKDIWAFLDHLEARGYENAT